MKYNQAVIGLSVNPELAVSVKDKQGPKKTLHGTNYYLSGSSGNVTIALKKLGALTHLIGLVGVGEHQTLADMLLPEAARRSGVSFTPIRILRETNLCIVPIIEEKNTVLWGKRNKIVRSAIPKAVRKLSRLEVGMGPRTFTVITGLRATEMALAKALLQKAHNGFRVLSPNHSLCAKKEIRKVLPLVDLLVLNNAGFEATGLSLAELHSCGPRIIVVTKDKDGGMFSINMENSETWTSEFGSYTYRGGKFETGAGDWFLGALVSELVRLRRSILSINLKQFSGVVHFAAKVAGKKITMPGGGNGPSRQQLRQA